MQWAAVNMSQNFAPSTAVVAQNTCALICNVQCVPHTSNAYFFLLDMVSKCLVYHVFKAIGVQLF